MMNMRTQFKGDLMSQENAYPVSFGQEGLWSLEKMEEVRTAYGILIPMQIVSQYSTKHLKEFFQQFITRHTSCSTTFKVINGELQQVISENPELDFRVVDAKNYDSEQLKTEAQKAHEEPFDLESGPLFKVFLFTQSDTKALLLISVHHIISDGFSLSIIIDELKNGYSALVKSKKYTPTPLKQNYYEYGTWQKELIKSEIGQKQKEYWHKKLSGELPVIQLPIDNKRTSTDYYKGDIHSFHFSEGQQSEISKFNKLHKTSMFSFFMSVYQLLLHKYSGQTDLIIGHPSSGRMRTAAGRKRSDYNNNFGYFINPLLYRSQFEESTDFLNLTQSTTKTVKEDFKNQDYPFSLLHNELQLRQRDLNIPQTLLNFHKKRNDHKDISSYRFNMPEQKEIDLGELTIVPYYLPQQEGSADLEWEVIESNKEIYCNLKYRTDIFEQETIERMEGHIRSIITQVLHNPEISLSEISLLSAEEKKLILTDFNNTAIDISSFKDLTIPELFEQQVLKTPDNIAVELNDTRLTYDQLNNRANQLAQYLQEKGVTSEQVVGLMLDRSLDMIVTILGIQKAGGAYLPIDSKLPDERKSYMLQNSGSKICITSSNLKKPSPEECTFIELDTVELDSFSVENLESKSTAQNLAYIIYTSGSTGDPKGVMLEHTGFISMILDHQKELDIDGSDTILQFASLSFDASIFEIFLALFSGSKLVLADQSVVSQPTLLASYIEAQKITATLLPPVMLKQLDPLKLRSIKKLITGGEAPVIGDVEEYRKSTKYINAYGPTEGTVIISYHLIPAEGDLPLHIPIGKPIDNTRIYILNEQKQLCPIGVQGEIYSSGIGVARGYINNPELTAEKFLPDPFFPEERMYKTGDLGKWLADGTIEFGGRIDHQIKISGYRVELGEIEQQLMMQPAISQASVVDCINSQGTKYLTAFIVRESGLSEAEIKKALGENLPYYMIPSSFHFLEELPSTSNGKVDRKALLQLEENSFTKPQSITSPKRTEKISSDIEERLTQIWKDILSLESCDREKNFFDLGGHSLQVVELQNRILRELDLDLVVADLFTYSTIASLSQHINSLTQEESDEKQNETGATGKDIFEKEDIAIIGMAGKFPGAANIDSFWENLKSGTESIRTFTKDELIEEGVPVELIEDSSYVPSKGYLEDSDLFDAHFFEFNPRDAELTDPQHRIFLQVAFTAIEHAGYDYKQIDVPVGVFASTGYSSYLQQNIGSDTSFQDRDFHQTMIALM